MSTPNTFIIGCPKSGTTAVSRFLSAHPQVFFSEQKEIHFFVKDEMPQLRVLESSLDDYLQHFRQATEQHTVVAEGSVWHLYSRVAAARIRKLNEDAKIIIMLRRPDEMLYAQHSTHVLTGIESEKSFAAAWQRSKASVSDESDEAPLLITDYLSIAKFHDQVSRVLSVFDSKQLLVVFYDDFVKDNAAFFQRIVAFLGIDTGFEPQFEKINSNRNTRLLFLNRIINRPPIWIIKTAMAVKRLSGIKKLGVISALVNLNSVDRQREEMDPELKKEIIAAHLDDITRLEALLQVDLSSWKR